MNGVAVYLLVLAGVFLVPLSISVAVTRLRLGAAEIAVGVGVLLVVGVGLVAWGIDSALHPSADKLAHTITSAPVPPRAKLLSTDFRDGDIEQQPQASMSYVLPGLPQQECSGVVQTYLDAGYRVFSPANLPSPAKPVLSATTVCVHGSSLELSVCKGEGAAEKCFSATLAERTAEQRDLDGPGAPAGNSVLSLEA